MVRNECSPSCLIEVNDRPLCCVGTGRGSLMEMAGVAFTQNIIHFKLGVIIAWYHLSLPVQDACSHILWEWNFCYHLILICWCIKNISQKIQTSMKKWHLFKVLPIICKQAFLYIKFNLLHVYKVIYERNIVWCPDPETIRGKGWGGL